MFPWKKSEHVAKNREQARRSKRHAKWTSNWLSNLFQLWMPISCHVSSSRPRQSLALLCNDPRIELTRKYRPLCKRLNHRCFFFVVFYSGPIARPQPPKISAVATQFSVVELLIIQNAIKTTRVERIEAIFIKMRGGNQQQTRQTIGSSCGIDREWKNTQIYSLL